MRIKDIAIKNLLRRKGKAAFVLAGLVIGVATVVAIISYVDAMTADINEKLEKYGANILIVPRTDNLALSYGGITLGGVSYEMQEIRQAEVLKIGSIKNNKNIAAVGPIVLGGVDTGGRRVLMAGVDFEAAEILKPWWKVAGAYPRSNQALLGSEVARVLGIATGGTVMVDGQPITVAGILQPTGSQDDQLIFTDLGTAQAMLGKSGVVSMVEVAALCKDCPITDMVRQISGAMPLAKVMAIQSVVKGRMETLGQFKKFSFGISAVIVLIGGLVVLVTLMGSVRERRQEIGIFRAIGFRKRNVMQIIFLEAGIVSFLAGLIGYGVGILGAALGLRLLSDSHSSGVIMDPALAGSALLIAVTVGLIASAYPAFLASRMDPNDALKAM
ncbi:ABC-type antimicrobial peptide transport system, permease component [Olavius algarvensis associated proteobacterium Delta 3]|nr:ABC-type antimicrobial peptide transport system, permease component [Olavius algarvensis associated proteobacterium Delta 3]CAB5137695.1 ABC-type antimicrobial peptide transport system, permease component [Olavius algarvensis associated proteobacterium Delta 3]